MVREYGEHDVKGDYYVNVTNLDRTIGRILKKLDDLKLSENTLVFFTSANVPAEYIPDGYFNKSHRSAGPLHGYKRHMFDGGIRVPAIFRWKGKIKLPQVNYTPISHTDLLPTPSKLTDIEIPTDHTMDGADIDPILFNEPFKRHKPPSAFL